MKVPDVGADVQEKGSFVEVKGVPQVKGKKRGRKVKGGFSVLDAPGIQVHGDFSEDPGVPLVEALEYTRSYFKLG